LEAGVEPKQVRKAMLEHNLTLRTCLVSHKHGDHAKYLKDVLKMGISTFAHPSVFEELNSPARYIQPVNEHTVIDTPDGYHIRFFAVEHDAPCFAFFITHAEGRIFFITDTMYCRYILPKNLSLAMLECNYDDETLQYNIENGITDPAMQARLKFSHMELQTTIDMLRNTEQTRQTLLLHLSHDNADPDKMVHKIQSATAVPTAIATTGLVLEF